MGSAVVVLHRQPVGIKASLLAQGKLYLRSPDQETKTLGICWPGHQKLRASVTASEACKKIWVRNGPHCLCKEALSCWPGTTTLSITKLN